MLPSLLQHSPCCADLCNQAIQLPTSQDDTELAVSTWVALGAVDAIQPLVDNVLLGAMVEGACPALHHTIVGCLILMSSLHMSIGLIQRP